MPKRKIIFTVTNDLSYDQRMQRICTSLARVGYDVTLVGRSLAASQPLDQLSFSQRRLSCFFHKGKLFYIEYNLRLFFYLLLRSADIICAIDLDTIVPCYYAAKIKDAKIVYDAHELFPEVPEVVRRPRIQKIWQWVEKTFVPRMDLVYTVSESISDLFAREYDRKVFTIRNLPYLSERYKDTKPTLFKYLLYQGALNEGRGIEHIIAAMQSIDTNLWLVGEGDITTHLKGLVDTLNLADKVHFLGYKKPQELKSITEEAYIGLNLLERKGNSYYYSLANKFLDYIQAGVPQICISFPEYKRINDQYHIAELIDDLEIDTIKSAIKRLIDDKELYEKLKENTLVCRLDLNWQNEEQKLIALYGSLC
jgi:glycosyltransferase involved in cell wall biosynthesis